MSLAVEVGVLLVELGFTLLISEKKCWFGACLASIESTTFAWLDACVELLCLLSISKASRPVFKETCLGMAWLIAFNNKEMVVLLVNVLSVFSGLGFNGLVGSTVRLLSEFNMTESFCPN